jgi:hypothetical protein
MLFYSAELQQHKSCSYTLFPSGFPEIKVTTAKTGNLGGHSPLLIILSLNTSHIVPMELSAVCAVAFILLEIQVYCSCTDASSQFGEKMSGQ